MENAYIILRKGYEYDDSIYEEVDGRTPDLIVFSKEDAEEKVKELNIDEYKAISLNNYSYSISEILNVSLEEYNEFNEKLNQKYGKVESKYSWESNEYKLHPKANREESLEYSKMVSLTFYEWVETKIDKQSHRNSKIDQIL